MIDWLQIPFSGSSPRLNLLLACTLAVLAGLVAESIAFRVARRLAAAIPLAACLLRRVHPVVRFLLPLLGVHLVVGAVPDAPTVPQALVHLLDILLIGTLTLLSIRAIQAIGETIRALHPADVTDNLRARAIHTQSRVLTRTAMAVVGLIGLASILMTFPGVRQIGTSLLASAGVAGLVAGMAARPVLGNLIAGLQIAIAQPIRLDDVLIVQGEWGRVEEITGSYVVLQIWDQRRLVIPLEWFISNPFENWTRRNSEIIGTVFLWVDYAMPLAPLRAELERVCHAAPEWDGRLCLLQVTDSSDKAMQVRALVSAADASLAWDLRCRVREALIDFLQSQHADCLPRLRAAVDGAAA